MQLTTQNLRVLTTGFKAVFQGAFDGAPSDYDKVAMVVPSDGPQETYGWMGATTQFREWLGDRVIQNIGASDYTVKNRSYENTVAVDRDDIEDDKLGIYRPLVSQLGLDARQHPDQLIFALLAAGFASVCYDGQYFFDTDHPVGSGTVSNSGGGAGTPWYLLDTSKALRPLIFQKRKDYQFVSMDQDNDEAVFSARKIRYGVDARVSAGYGLWQLAYGSKQTLDATNYAAARAAMGGLKGDNGKPLGVRGTLLVVPPSLESAALTLVNADQISGSTNVLKGTAQVLVTPWLA